MNLTLRFMTWICCEHMPKRGGNIRAFKNQEFRTNLSYTGDPGTLLRSVDSRLKRFTGSVGYVIQLS